MAPPLVSVIVPVFNGERFLGECLESIFAQDYRPFEVIVVDDGSTDNTATVAGYFPAARYIYQSNQGPAAARNAGIAAANGQFIAFFDHDDVMVPAKLTIQVGYLLRHPEVGLVVGHEKVFCEPGVHPPVWMQPRASNEKKGSAPEMSAVVRREVLDAVGGFDPNFRIAEDTEWTSRALARGFIRYVCPEVVMHRRFHGANLSYANPGVMAMTLRVLRARVADKRIAAPGDRTTG